MANDTKLTVVLTAKDELTSKLKSIKDVVNQTADSTTSVNDKLRSQLENLVRGVGAFDAVIVSLAMTVTGTLTKAFIDFGKSSVKAFTEAEEATAKLNKMLENTGSSAESIAELNKFMKESTNGSVVSEANLNMLAKQLATFDLSAEGIQSILPALANMAIVEKGLNASMADYQQLGQMMGKAVQGDFSGLKRMGFIIPKSLELQVKATKSEAKRLELLTEVLGHTYNDAADNIANTFVGQSQIFKNTLDKINRAFGGATITNFLQPMADELKKTYEGVDWYNLFYSDMGVEEMKKSLAVMIQKAFESLPTLINTVADYLDMFFDGLGMAIEQTDPSKLVTSILHLGAVLTKAVVTLIISSIKGLYAHLDEINEELAKFFSDAFKKLSDKLAQSDIGQIFKPITDFFANNPGLFKGILQFIEAFGTIAVVLGTAFIAVVGIMSIFEALVGVFSLLFSPLGLIIAALALLYVAWQNDWGGIQEKTQWVWEQLQTFFDWMMGIPDQVVQTWNSVVEWFNALPGNISAWLEQTQQSIEDWFWTTHDNAIKWLEDTWLAIKEWFIRLPYELGFWLGELGAKIALWTAETSIIILDWLLDTYTNMCHWVQDTIDSVVQFFSELPDRIWAWLVNAYEKTVEWLNNTWTTTTTKTKSLVDSVVKYFSELPGRIKTWFDDALEKTKQWLSDMYNKSLDGIKKVSDVVITTIKELPDKIYNVGKDIVTGLWEGIKSMTDWLGYRISEFVHGVMDGFKAGFEIGSPSKLFAEMGRFNIEGLGLGMREAISSLDIPTIVAEISGNFDKAMQAYTPQPAYATSGNTYNESRNSSVSLNGVTINNGLDVEAVAQYLGATIANAIY